MKILTKIMMFTKKRHAALMAAAVIWPIDKERVGCAGSPSNPNCFSGLANVPA